MIIRLVGTPADLPLLLRQSPGNSGAWGDCVFSTTATECDACVVSESIPAPIEVFCPPAQTLFFAGEPPSIRTYHAGFLAQFERVVSCQTRLKHPRVHIEQPALPWHLGMNHSPLPHLPNPDDFRALDWNDKSFSLSVICSNKAFTPGHRARLEFVGALKELLGDQLQVYGRGVREIEDKWQAIVPYAYHIALENSRVEHYWTEKLADAFLGGAFPFYVGAPNIGDYFPPESLQVLPFDSPQKAAAIIQAAIAQNRAAQTIEARIRARDLVLDPYNRLAVAARILQTHQSTDAPRRRLTLRPEPQPKPPFALRVKNRLRRLSGGQGP